MASLFGRARRRLLGPGKPKVAERIFFLHIPKCAGTALSASLGDLYPDPKHVFGLDHARSRRAAEALGVPVPEVRRHLLQYAMELPETRLIRGHFQWSDAAYAAHGSAWDYVTVLRDPVERYISAFHFNRKHPDPDHFGAEGTLEEYLETERGRIEGRQLVRHLCEGADDLDDDAAVACARANLAKFALVGDVGRLGSFADAFASRYGSRLRVGMVNSNPDAAAARRSHEDEALIGRVREVCAADIALYEHAMTNYVV